jgi:dipeptidyl aminopeptidase/acylaminoacyl peptidase
MGYGKHFLEAGDKESGRKMIADVIDGTNWVITQGIADPKHLGIYGRSYGGYLTLCGLAFYPDLFACGIDYVGVSDLVTLLNNTYVPYWKPIQDVLFQRIGNPFTEKQLLIDQSPLTQVDKIKAPLFIAYGANDVRVNRIQSEKMITTLQERGRLSEPPLLKDNEGHGFKNFNNAFEFTEKADSFFKKYLLTQAENKSIQEGESKSNENNVSIHLPDQLLCK